MTPVFITATTLEDAWFQLLYKLIDVGKTFTIDSGSYKGEKRLEFDYITVQIKYPGTRPLLPIPIIMLLAAAPLPKSNKATQQLGFPFERNQNANVSPLLPVKTDGICTY